MMSPQDIAEFAAKHVAVKEGLDRQTDFPGELWKEMGEAGLLGLYLPQSWGGGGLGSASMVEAGEAFVRAGGNLGMATAWFGHALVARYFLLGFGNADQQAAWLPALAEGRITASVAISEPGAGAHPKHLSSEALREGDGYRLHGEKYYVTNGNIAGLFIVVAITDTQGGRKRFSAFLLPRDCPGLTVQDMPPLDYLRPSQHVRLKLNGCKLPASALLGEEGAAFQSMARPFRDVEDIMNAGPKLGALAYQLDALLDALRDQDGKPGQELNSALGGLGARLEAMRMLARQGAGMLDERPEAPQLEKLALALRIYTGEFQDALAQARTLGGSPAHVRLDAMTHELSRMRGLAGDAVQAKLVKLAGAMLAGRS